ncbi:11659_t:CDS:2 [Acaulospora morrowiae]|uniref:11659_t:CDS:1 n=1 Tax=Acaulospora morrowiae TaxID=94023 RepID=A0A9N8ZJ66_9GLOM|nr:11659_t:CDS:2 [Acaulospora morrowiae]
MSSPTKIETVVNTWCVYILFNPNNSKVYVGNTHDLKERLQKHNRLSNDEGKEVWEPIVAITGFLSSKEATSFEMNIKLLAKKKEYNEYANLYQGRCPSIVLKRIIAIRGLLCEHDQFWKAPRGKKRRYVLHWGSYMERDTRQLVVLQTCPWARVGRYVKHKRMNLSDQVTATRTSSSDDLSSVSSSSSPERPKSQHIVEKIYELP